MMVFAFLMDEAFGNAGISRWGIMYVIVDTLAWNVSSRTSFPDLG
jgi:hypothetical protein